VSTLPICERSEIPRLLCHCCDSFTMTDVERAFLAGRPSPPPWLKAAPKMLRLVESKVSRPIHEYRAVPWVEPRAVKVVDSANPCHVARCDRPAGDAFVCPQCVDDLEVSLGDAPALLEDGRIAAEKDARFTAAAAGGGTPLVFSPEAAERVAKLENELTTTVRMLCEHRGLDVPTLDAEGASRWLLTNIQSLALDIGGPEALQHIIAATTAVRKVIDRPDGRVYIGLCHKDRSAMYARKGRAEHQCKTCGETYVVEQMLAEQQLKVMNLLLTLREIADLSATYLGGKITIPQLKGLVRRKRLATAGDNAEGVAMYRAADVVAIMHERHTA
jgi:hypothetical protein